MKTEWHIKKKSKHHVPQGNTFMTRGKQKIMYINTYFLYIVNYSFLHWTFIKYTSTEQYWIGCFLTPCGLLKFLWEWKTRFYGGYNLFSDVSSHNNQKLKNEKTPTAEMTDISSTGIFKNKMRIFYSSSSTCPTRESVSESFNSVQQLGDESGQQIWHSALSTGLSKLFSFW